MKLLLSLVTALPALSVFTAGVSALLVLYGAELMRPLDANSFLGGLLLASLGLSTITGLATSIAAALLGFLLIFIHMILKRWIAAFFSLLCCLSGAGLWLFFATN